MSAMPDAASRCPRKWHLLFAPGISFSWLKIALTKLCTYPSAFVRDPKIHLHVVHHSGQGTDNHLIYTESLPLPEDGEQNARFTPEDGSSKPQHHGGVRAVLHSSAELATVRRPHAVVRRQAADVCERGTRACRFLDVAGAVTVLPAGPRARVLPRDETNASS